MSREIKFRGWIRGQQRMVGPLSIEEVAKRWSLPLHWCDLMQYTGLHDKNGKEIYEGDIVRFTDKRYRDNPQNIGFVSFGSGSFYIRGAYMTHYRWIDYECEVVGDVHQNFDLLEDGGDVEE